MATPRPGLLLSADLRAALAVVGTLAAAIDDADAFARCGIGRLTALMAVDLTALARVGHADGTAHAPRDTPPALPASLPLSAREHEVLRWVAAGKTDRDVADILGISPRTVHKHLQRVYDKLGVETRTAAVMRALAAH